MGTKQFVGVGTVLVILAACIVGTETKNNKAISAPKKLSTAVSRIFKSTAVSVVNKETSSSDSCYAPTGHTLHLPALIQATNDKNCQAQGTKYSKTHQPRLSYNFPSKLLHPRSYMETLSQADVKEIKSKCLEQIVFALLGDGRLCRLNLSRSNEVMWCNPYPSLVQTQASKVIVLSRPNDVVTFVVFQIFSFHPSCC